ncbi:non-ribosomal peptide synthetase [Wocania ichthyoenteri]|uniref:non-ribosomal peptide synthetase n=1 Tax=Wocania ichthyoenteri TaxID=1230531 RepID=UPI00053CFD23|nr:non-ribosomal peptide synthetase [Wocania ichthyoenteri]
MENKYTKLTQNQKLLWLGQELNPDSPMYNMVMSYEIKDAISLPKFRIAFQKLVEKSDVLRSVFYIQEGEPIQRYLSKVDYEVEFKDFSNQQNPKKAYKTWEKERAHNQFNLEKCAFDSVLIKLSEHLYVWYFNQYHLISDGWSTSLIFSKMSDYYAKALENKLENLEELPSYNEYVTNSQKVKTGDNYKEALKYWGEKLKNFPSPPSFYYQKDVSFNTASDRLNIKLGKERSNKIRQLANEKGVRVWTLDLTLYNIFLTTLFAFLNRVTGQEYLVIGSPVHNRTSKKIKNTIGFFIETFPLLVEVDEEDTFMSLLQKVQLESNSFLKYAQAGASTADLNRGFNVLFNYINNINPKFNDAPVTTSWVHPGHHDPRHHLRLHVHDFDNSGEIQLYFDFNTNVFNTQKQKVVSQHFLKLLDAFIENHNQQINSVNLITDVEVSTIEDWNNTTVEYPKNETLLSKFEAQVLKIPNLKALVFEEELVTYKVLNEKSNQVARFLTQKGIQKNDIVIVSLDRSLEMMFCIYGIIKSGAAYLPVATDIPSERLKFIINDAKAKILFYNHDSIDGDVLKSIDCFYYETIKEQIDLLDSTSNNIKILPDDLAYVIYTSGSTGKPKGVLCHHEGICNRLNWMNSKYPISIDDTFIQKTPITFDVSLWELFWPTQEGATLVIESPEGHKNPDKLIETIKNYRVTNIHFVPSMLNVFIQTNEIENCNSLNRIFCSGEVLSVPIVEKTYNKLDVEIYNLYGPTEASVDVTSWYCKKEDLFDGILIGKPVANTQLHILDKNLNQLPIGLKGELYIAGKQVAKGYLNRERLTNERFVKNIFSDAPNAKMYKTGDLARYRADGEIEYHGRIDNQIKIRGLRIELGEIENNIERLPEISQAIVSVDKQDNLVAYYTGEKIEGFELITTLKLQLPEYMIPQSYMHLEQFELLSSGKVNRRKLPEYNSLTIVQETGIKLGPKNEIEEIILNVWKEVLGIDKIGVNENFIRIGGNSLSAISITSRIKRALELELLITDVFNYPTIRVYANYVEQMITKLLNE